jgi:uncharacterized protein
MLNRPEGTLFVRACHADAIVIVDRELRSSFILSPDRLIEAWPARTVADLIDEALQPILDLRPQVVLLGTGAKVHFPAQATLAQFLTRGIGIEVMDNSAACRTFNLLVSEGRNVVAALML